MYKVLQKTDSLIYVGNDNGELIKIDRKSQLSDFEIGDYVEIFRDNETTIITPAKTRQKKSKNEFLKKFIPINKIVTRIAIVLFAICLVGLIVICSVPHGKKYRYAYNEFGYEVNMTCYFDDDIVTIVTKVGDNEDEISTCKYKIVEGKLYTFVEGSYLYDGKITSTKLTLSYSSINLVLVENTLSTLKTLSIVFMSISGALMLAGITFIILNKKGVIKVEQTKIVEQTKPIEQTKFAEQIKPIEQKEIENKVEFEVKNINLEIIDEKPTISEKENCLIEEDNKIDKIIENSEMTEENNKLNEEIENYETTEKEDKVTEEIKSSKTIEE